MRSDLTEQLTKSIEHLASTVDVDQGLRRLGPPALAPAAASAGRWRQSLLAASVLLIVFGGAVAVSELHPNAQGTVSTSDAVPANAGATDPPLGDPYAPQIDALKGQLAFPAEAPPNVSFADLTVVDGHQVLHVQQDDANILVCSVACGSPRQVLREFSYQGTDFVIAAIPLGEGDRIDVPAADLTYWKGVEFVGSRPSWLVSSLSSSRIGISEPDKPTSTGG